MGKMSKREFDLIVFGATGFTGQFVVEEVAQTVAQDENKHIKWAIAGRNREKLVKVLESASNELKKKLNNIQIIEADISDEESIVSMCKRTRVVINTVGPYRFYGEQVVKACVDNGTHHVDISGEAQWLERMQAKYHQQAEENSCYIVGACGWDSIPVDVGVQYVKKNFDGHLNLVETYAIRKSGKQVSVKS